MADKKTGESAAQPRWVAPGEVGHGAAGSARTRSEKWIGPGETGRGAPLPRRLRRQRWIGPGETGRGEKSRTKRRS